MKEISVKIIVDEMMKDFPTFGSVPDPKKKYLFSDTTHPMNHFILISHSSKHVCFEVNLSSNIFGKFCDQYGEHLTRSTCRLPNLRENSGIVPSDRAQYPYNGTLDGAKSLLRKISGEIRECALPWFSDNESNLTNGSLLQVGILWIRKNMERIPSDISDQIEKALKKCRHNTLLVRNYLLDELKAHLRDKATNDIATNRDRRDIGNTAIDLLTHAHMLKGSPDSGGHDK